MLDFRRDVVHLSDVALVAAITRRDRTALAEAYRRHGACVHAAARLVAGRDGADEIVHQVFLHLWRRPERFEPHQGSLRTFLIRRTHRGPIDLRTPMVPEAETAALPYLVGEDLWHLLSALDNDERDAIALAYGAGCTYREVARVLQQPEGTVKTLIRKGLGRLRDGFQDESLHGRRVPLEATPEQKVDLDHPVHDPEP